jgi:serine/threonine-protein kinase mTOR
LKSKTSDVWVERRANFTKTTAVMSVVGYLLGLGDRHLANIMLERKSGKIVHIDFGDCFESTMNRAQYPEKVPFRLTRMMTNAMEASGIEGTFRSTCEKVMGVLRGNGDSLQAMLEAFLHDPLVDWKGKETILYTEPATEDGAVPEENETSDEHEKTKTEETSAPRVRNDVSINSRALEVVGKIQLKLTGGEFLNSLEREIDQQKSNLTVQEQVDKLITQATSAENLCLHYYGWKPFW